MWCVKCFIQYLLCYVLLCEKSHIKHTVCCIPYEHIIWTVCDIQYVFYITWQISLNVTGLELYDRWIFNIFYVFYVPKSIHKPLSPTDLINLICFNELEHRYNFSWIIQYYWHYKKMHKLCSIMLYLRESEKNSSFLLF